MHFEPWEHHLGWVELILIPSEPPPIVPCWDLPGSGGQGDRHCEEAHLFCWLGSLWWCSLDPVFHSCLPSTVYTDNWIIPTRILPGEVFDPSLLILSQSQPARRGFDPAALLSVCRWRSRRAFVIPQHGGLELCWISRFHLDGPYGRGTIKLN